jgi:hypothetical protein
MHRYRTPDSMSVFDPTLENVELREYVIGNDDFYRPSPKGIRHFKVR